MRKQETGHLGHLNRETEFPRPSGHSSGKMAIPPPLTLFYKELWAEGVRRFWPFLFGWFFFLVGV